MRSRLKIMKRSTDSVMAALVAAIHVFPVCFKDVDARHHRRAKRRRPSDDYGRA
jgi:hypothetical protein